MTDPLLRDTPEEWTHEQAALFVRMNRFMSLHQRVMCHPQAAEIPAEHWATLCHNAAWYAAERMAMDPVEDDLRFLDSDTEEVLGDDSMPGTAQ